MHRTKSDNAGENAQNNDCNAERNELRRKLMDEWEMVRQERDKAIKREPGNFVNLASATSSYSTQMSALQQQMNHIWDMSCQDVRRLNAQFKKTVGPGIYGNQPPDIDLSDFMEWITQGKGLGDVIDEILPDIDLSEFEKLLDEEVLPYKLNDEPNTIHPKKKKSTTISVQAVNRTLSAHSQTVITDLLRKAGQESAKITSVTRTPEDQARIMFDKLEGKTGGKDRGVDGQKALYGKKGDSVIDVYLKAKDAGDNDVEIKRKMIAQIYAVGPSKVSKHCADPSKLNAIDIDPKSINHKEVFEEVLEEAKKKGIISNYLKPPLDSAYHIEIPQPPSKE